MTSPSPTRSPRRTGGLIAILVVLALVVGVVVAAGIWVYRSVEDFLGAGGGCVAEVDGTQVEISAEQAENASLIAAIGVRRELPTQAVTIALATAYQESKIVNIDYGDRDSVGLFQQRPSQGWGTEEELLDPYYSINAFYDALIEIADYTELPVTEAAQEVQRSGFPDAYADHEDDARILAAALTGDEEAGFTCAVDAEAVSAADPDGDATSIADVGLTARAAAVRTELIAAFGELSLGGFEPGGVDSGHSEDSAHYDGRAVDVFTRPVNEETQRTGWAIAHYLVAHAESLDIATVIYDGLIWTARRSDSGWRTYDIDTSGVSAETAEILEHRDHVHVDVFD